MSVKLKFYRHFVFHSIDIDLRNLDVNFTECYHDSPIESIASESFHLEQSQDSPFANLSSEEINSNLREKLTDNTQGWLIGFRGKSSIPLNTTTTSKDFVVV